MSSNTRITPEKVGRVAAKVAAEAAYVVAGLTDIVAGTVQDVVKQSRYHYTERKAAGEKPVVDYAKGVPAQMKGFVGELKDAYTGLSARGRTVFSDGFSSTAHRPVRQPESQPESPDFEQPPAS